MNTKNDKRKTYVKPAMQVYELKKQPQLLIISGTGSMDNREDYVPIDDSPFTN